jgi:hypothetical protein
LGRFLSQDSYLGEAENAPSLHRYLYAYANPTVWVDLTGYAGTVAQPGLRPDPIGYAISQHLQSDYDENGQSVAQEILTPISDFVEGAWSGAKNLAEMAAKKWVEINVLPYIVTEDSGSTILTTPIHEKEPTVLTTPIHENEPTVLTTPIQESGPTTYTTPIQENGPTVYVTPDQSDLIDSGPYLREQERDESGRFKASTDIPEGRLNRAYPWAETKRQIQQQAIDQGFYNPETGNFIDPNTLEEIEGDFHYGHTFGNESWRTRDEATRAGVSQAEYNKSQQDTRYWQIESPKSNLSHEYEKKD